MCFLSKTIHVFVIVIFEGKSIPVILKSMCLIDNYLYKDILQLLSINIQHLASIMYINYPAHWISTSKNSVAINIPARFNSTQILWHIKHDPFVSPARVKCAKCWDPIKVPFTDIRSFIWYNIFLSKIHTIREVWWYTARNAHSFSSDF